MQNPKPWPKSEIQNPNGCAWGCHRKNGYYDNPSSKIQDPKSKYQNPRSKIQIPKSKIQTPRSKIQDPNSKIQTSKQPIWFLDFGVWIWVAGLGWLCSKRSCMDGPPKFGVVGRDSSWYAKGRRLDSPRSNRAPISRGWFLLETEPRFPALHCGNWVQISRKMVASCGVPSNYSMGSTSWTRGRKGNKIGCRSLLLPCPLITGWNCGCFWFLGFFMRAGWWTKKYVKNFCSGKQFLMWVAAMHGDRVGGWQALAC